MQNKSIWEKIAVILVLVGGVNWGLVGLGNINIVSLFLGDFSLLTRLVYLLIGVSAVYLIYLHFTKKKV